MWSVNVIDKFNPIAMHINKPQGYNHGNTNYKERSCDYCHFTGII